MGGGDKRYKALSVIAVVKNKTNKIREGSTTFSLTFIEFLAVCRHCTCAPVCLLFVPALNQPNRTAPHRTAWRGVACFRIAPYTTYTPRHATTHRAAQSCHGGARRGARRGPAQGRPRQATSHCGPNTWTDTPPPPTPSRTRTRLYWAAMTSNALDWSQTAQEHTDKDAWRSNRIVSYVYENKSARLLERTTTTAGRN